jgi:hypothetical protein
MSFLKAASAVFGGAALIAFADAGVTAWKDDLYGSLFPLAAAGIFGIPAFFMLVFTIDFPVHTPSPPPPSSRRYEANLKT